jgi:phenylacetate-coenzyme A ligase PaaK-like adenylate-forming protein
LLQGIGGRSEDVVQLMGRDGKPVSLSPMVIFDCMIELAEIAEYQHRVEKNHIHLRVVPRRGADRDALKRRAKQAVTAALEKLGAEGFDVEVETVDRIVRSAEGMGKLKVLGGK